MTKSTKVTAAIVATIKARWMPARADLILSMMRRDGMTMAEAVKWSRRAAKRDGLWA